MRRIVMGTVNSTGNIGNSSFVKMVVEGAGKIGTEAYTGVSGFLSRNAGVVTTVAQGVFLCGGVGYAVQGVKELLNVRKMPTHVDKGFQALKALIFLGVSAGLTTLSIYLPRYTNQPK
jgi:hypothetical protein